MTRAWEKFPESVLDAFGAQAGVTDGGVGALRLGTRAGNGGSVAANVTQELLSGAMEGERNGTVRALGDITATRALERGGPAPAIEEQDGLFLAFEALGEGLLEFLGKDLDPLDLTVLSPQVDDADDGHLPIVHAAGHLQERVFPAVDIVEAFHRRRGRTENNDGAFHLATDHGDVARVVARGFLLLVGVFVFLVHDEKAQRFDGREDGRACADDDPGAALANLLPLVVALAGTQVAVENGDEGLELAGVEPGLESLDRLRRERDFRDQDDCTLTLRKGVGDGLEINFGLPRAGDAVEEEGAGG